MIYQLPTIWQMVLLPVLGSCFGSAINYGIYAWSWSPRWISPWQVPHPDASRRTWQDRIPVWGWLRLRRDRALHGNAYWLRPLLLELVWIVGLPWFFHWQQAGGLVGGQLNPVPPGWHQISEVWFWLQAVLIALMFVATFIDFDERTIPDAVTIPGTLFALLIAAWCPLSRLPEVSSNLAGQIMVPVSFANGASQPMFGIRPVWFSQGVQWHLGSAGLWVSLFIYWGWILALMPRICTLRYGIRKAIWVMIYSCWRPKRKTVCSIRTSQRRPEPETVMLAGLGLVGTCGILIAKELLPTANWESLFQACFGLGFGGLMIWAIRIIGHLALQKEAMGFGDVTLMGMIGTFLGWQAALLTLPLAVVMALIITVCLFIFTRDNQLAFGPYLCLGCAAVLFSWNAIWPATRIYFSLGEWLFYLLGLMLGLMLGMLAATQLVKRWFGLT
jgi:prepilin signal peptidase PulO-like enzyme (type II secretory pathway)